jgi:molybdate transport system substrate-binding protein
MPAPRSAFRTVRRRLACLVLAVSALGATAPVALAQDVTVFAAASLQTALDEINASWSADTGKSAALSYAGSSALARQIEEGAPADLFISADLAWMDYLEEKGLVRAETRHDLLGNSIVLVAPAGPAEPVAIDAGLDLLAQLGADGRLAMADTEAVPAGRYGREALTTLGLWDAVEPRVAAAENVRAALLLVLRGEAPLGIVYRTDANADPSVEVLGTFPADSHQPIVYPVALTTAATSADAAAFADYLRGPEARAIFEEQGFTILD